MRKYIIACLLILSINSFTTISCKAWGVYGHKHIIKAAIMSLPTQEMGFFFYAHLNELLEESIVPDIRKYAFSDKAEFPRHYINIELYNNGNWNTIPKTMPNAKATYDSLFLMKNGILPWYMQEMMERLTTAMKTGNKNELIILLGDLSHYIADAHMPLHTSVNHNGQITNQEGIHGLWESQLPEMFGNNYNYHIASPHFISHITDTCWYMIRQSHDLVGRLLETQSLVTQSFNRDDIFAYDKKGNLRKTKFKALIFSRGYAMQYHTQLKGMVEQQMRAAALMTASFWYTAWVNAGKPNLDRLDTERITAPLKTEYEKELSSFRQGELKNIVVIPEFE